MVSVGVFLYDGRMKNDVIIKAIKELVACGIPAGEAVMACEEFLQRFGLADFFAFVRAYEVAACGSI